MSSRAFEVLETINSGDHAPKAEPLTPLQAAKLQQHSSPAYQRFLSRQKKPSDPAVDSNSTIKYFRDISRRRVKSSPLPRSDVVGSTHYRPFDHEMLLQRIATYQRLLNWDISDKRLTPLECALKGWCCNTKKQNEIWCQTCSARMVVKLPKPQMTDDYELDEIENEVNERVVDKYLDLLVQGHKDNCAWKKQSTPMNVYEIGFTRMDKVVESFKERYEHNLKMLWDVEDVEIESVLTAQEAQIVTDWLVINNLEVDEEAIELSVLGWSVEKKDNGPTMLMSSSDGRRVLVGDDQINLLDEHQVWSCFVDGYKVLLDILKVLCHKTEHREEVPETPVQDDKNLEDFEVSTSTTPSNMGETLDRLNRMRELYLRPYGSLS